MRGQNIFVAALLIAWFASELAVSAVVHVPGEHPTIQEGINAASPGDTVLVECGTYQEHDITMRPGIHLMSRTGTYDCATIDATYSGRAVLCDSIGSTAVIAGFTIINGRSGQAPGAGICCIGGSSPILSRLLVRDNTTYYQGGGVYCSGGSSPELVDCVLAENSAHYGGGACLSEGCSPSFVRCAFSGNDANTGAGAACSGPSSPAFLECTFADNVAFVLGGAVSLGSSVGAVFDGVTFERNTVTFYGGAMSCSGPATLRSTVFEENSAGEGGGAIYCSAVSGGFDARECLFVANSASVGGAMHCGYGSAPSITNCTFSHNQAEVGGGLSLAQGSTVVARNNIIAYSTAGGAVHCDGSSWVSLECCDLYGNAEGDWEGCVADQYGIGGNMSLDPLFCWAANPSDPYSLRTDSPCLPDSNCDLIGARGVACPTTGLGLSTMETSWGSIKSRFRVSRLPN